MSIDLNEIKARIAKLSKMTIENGASENEALTAARKIAELLDSNGLTEAEIKAFETTDSDTSCKMETSDFGEKKKLHEVQFCVNAIAKFFDVKVWSTTMGTGNRVIRFFGFPQDVAAAMALTETLVYAMERDYKNWFATQSQDVHGKTLRKNFMLGFCSRVNSRLKDLKEEREVKAENNLPGTSLVILKNQVVESEAEKLNLRLRKASRSYSRANTSAYDAGCYAGSQVNLGNNKMISC